MFSLTVCHTYEMVLLIFFSPLITYMLRHSTMASVNHLCELELLHLRVNTPDNQLKETRHFYTRGDPSLHQVLHFFSKRLEYVGRRLFFREMVTNSVSSISSYLAFVSIHLIQPWSGIKSHGKIMVDSWCLCYRNFLLSW